ncbi:MAG: aminoacyl-tRNA hydrolase [Pseudomonadota bacterium]
MGTAETSIDLIVGLGNPGSEYAETRHNAGFWLVDEIARTDRQTFASETRFHGDVATTQIGARKVRLLKPTTFMNRSGQSVATMARYFKIPVENVLVVHDELDLSAGDARIKFGGGHGGHNGLRDMIAHFGSPNFWRIRLGISHPGHQSDVVNYVLKPPSRDDREKIDETISVILSVMPMVVDNDIQKATQKVHSRKPKPPKPDTQQTED